MIRPIVIVGAPRSGTSLLQKILRECPGFGSVPRESQHIWAPYVHPESVAWEGELVTNQVLNDRIAIASIRQQFETSALSAEQWQRLSGSRLLNSPLAKRLARLFPTPVVRAMSSMRGSNTVNFRLVEKSVHAGLWLPLVDAVFPDAIYLHIVRNPVKAVPSIMSGWLEAGRFESFRVPDRLDIEGYHGDRNAWCFPLPSGWRSYTGSSLLEVACFQWRAINQSISEFFDSTERRGRCLTVRLEMLTRKPAEALAAIRRHGHIEDSVYFDQFAERLPVVNEGSPNVQRPSVSQEEIWQRVGELAARLGYE